MRDCYRVSAGSGESDLRLFQISEMYKTIIWNVQQINSCGLKNYICINCDHSKIFLLGWKKKFKFWDLNSRLFHNLPTCALLCKNFIHLKSLSWGWGGGRGTILNFIDVAVSHKFYLELLSEQTVLFQCKNYGMIQLWYDIDILRRMKYDMTLILKHQINISMQNYFNIDAWMSIWHHQHSIKN